MVHRKIKMELVKNKTSRCVTFSKRRSGLFKKASELGILCGAQLAMVLFSPSGKPFSFGNPSFEAVTNKFFHQNPKSNWGQECKPSNKDGKINKKLNKELVDLMNQLQVEEKKEEVLDNALNKNKIIKGKLPILGLDLVELQKLKASLEELNGKLNLCIIEKEAATSLLLLAEKPVKRQRSGLVKLTENIL